MENDTNSEINSPKISQKHSSNRHSPNKHSPRKIPSPQKNFQNLPSHFQILKMTQKIHRNLKSLDFIHIDKENYSLENYIKILKKPLNVRSAEEIITIKHFLETSELEKKFEEDGIEKFNHEKMFVIFSTFVKFLFLKKNDIVYNKDDYANNIYIILNGEVDLYNMVIKEHELTGYEYFLKMLDYLETNKKLFDLTKEINKNVFDLQEIEDPDKLKMILLKIILIHDRVRKITKEIFEKVKFDYKNWDIDFEEMSSLKIIDLVKSKLSKFEDDVEQFIFLNDEKEKKKVFLYDFQKSEEIANSKLFGSNDHEKYKEKAVVSSDEVSLCVLPLEIYNEYVKEEKEIIKLKQLNFLFEKFFFKKMVKRKFEREFFPSFKKEIYKKGQIIIKENEPIEFVYFIEKGFVSLSTNKSLIELYHLNNYLNLAKIYKKKNIKFDFNLTLPKIQTNENELIKKIKEKFTQNILILGENEVVGNLCVFFDINNLFTVKVESEKVALFKIYKKYFQNIFTKDEVDVCKDYEISCFQKIERIQKRLNNINQVNFGIIEKNVENNKNNNNINNTNNNIENDNENNNENNNENFVEEKKKHKNDFNIENTINLENSYFFSGNKNDNLNFYKNKRKSRLSTRKKTAIENNNNNTLKIKTRNNTDISYGKFSTIDDDSKRKKKKNLFPKIRSFEDRLFEKVEKLKKKNNSILIMSHIYNNNESKFNSNLSNINNNNNNNSKINVFNKYEESSFLTSLNSKIINNNNNSNINEHFSTEISKINNIITENSNNDNNNNNNENTFNLPLIKSRKIRSPGEQKRLNRFKVFDNGGIFEDDYLYNNSLIFSCDKNNNKNNKNNFDFNYDNNNNIYFSNPNELFLDQFKRKQLFFKMMNERKKNNIKYKKEIMERINQKYYS